MQYEIEIKCLLPDKSALETLLKKIDLKDPTMKLVSVQRQRNHYFHGGSLEKLIEHAVSHLSAEQLENIKDINATATHINVRSRQKNDEVLLIVKGSLDDVSAAHSHHRMEFEGVVPLDIDQLDDLILESGWLLEAKWQANREIYSALGLTVDTIVTPGYGYMVEFERVVTDDSSREEAHQQILDVMESLGVEELPNDRLERMFAYYNEHWQEYYDTDKTFVVK
jgi:adenylate cyclase class IV